LTLDPIHRPTLDGEFCDPTRPNPTRPDPTWPMDGPDPCPCRPVRSTVPSSVTKLLNVICWKWMNRFWCKFAQVVHRATA